MIPTDDLYAKQWHLRHIGNVERIWDEYSGKGVNVGVYDDGIQYDHPDLNGNYDPSLHVRYKGKVYDGAPPEYLRSLHGHGTAVAGLIGAEQNGEGAVGVAWGSSLTGVTVLDWFHPLSMNALFPKGFYAAIEQSAKFDVVNHSWGPGDFQAFEPWQNPHVAGSFAAEVGARWAQVAAEGRGGLGTVIVKAAGNDDWDSSRDGLDASRFAVSVAAFRKDGLASVTSNHGANILVAAPGGEAVIPYGAHGIVTTDLLGTDGYNREADWDAASDYTDRFDGTSAAAPIVTGVVSLMLDAAPRLGWRDVHDVLAASATHTGDPIGRPNPPWPYDFYEDSNWLLNGAGNWNGGGMHFSGDYGFGAVDAYNAVRMAEVWHQFTPEAQTSANELIRSTGRMEAGLGLPDGRVATFRFAVDDALELDTAALTLRLTHDVFGIGLKIVLVSPEGTEVTVKDDTATGGAMDGLTWTFGIQAFRGEDARGIWTLRVEDTGGWEGYPDPPIGTLHWVDLDLHGRAVQTDDAYHYTDEFGAMARLGGEAGRRTLADADGGADWIDAAAVSGDAVVNLNPGAVSTLGGGTFAIARGTAIEHCVTGDGNDRLTGNMLGNELHGMRGNDRLEGRGGGDELAGGDGRDTFVCEGAFGGDLVLDFENGQDRFDLDAGLRFASLGLRQFDVDRDGALDDVRVEVAGRGTIGVLDVRLGAIDAADFVF